METDKRRDWSIGKDLMRQAFNDSKTRKTVKVVACFIRTWVECPTTGPLQKVSSRSMSIGTSVKWGGGGGGEFFLNVDRSSYSTPDFRILPCSIFVYLFRRTVLKVEIEFYFVFQCRFLFFFVVVYLFIGMISCSVLNYYCF